MNKKNYVPVIVLVTLAALFIKYSDSVFESLYALKGIVTPLLLGCAIAYILNIVVSKIESIPVFREPDGRLFKIRRPISILLSIAIILGIITLIILIVIPQLIDAVSVLAKAVPSMISRILSWISASDKDWTSIESFLNSLNVNWPEMLQKAVTHLTSGLNSIFTSTLVIIKGVGSVVVTFVVALIFSLYILSGRERLFRQIKAVARTYMKKKHYDRLALVLSTAHDTFTKFFIGQFTEAIIIGALCAAGMFILRLPYASMIGTLVGATALIPVVGAYLGAFIGAFMVFTVDPLKAVGFLVFIVILQQLEGNLIYPRVVGSSVGLPGIWVLAAVTIGGGLGGITGMLIAVPLTATLYRLLKRDVKMKNSGIGPSD